jgi:hypothetical protein
MAKVVYVTKAQQIAAQMIVERKTASGMAVPAAISMIANASTEPDSGAEVTVMIGDRNKSKIGARKKSRATRAH